jgi:RNA polymerase sigma-70 factor (ECF subfamily)
MRRVDQVSQREVAQKLGISEKSVEKHVMKGMKLLAAAFRSGPRQLVQEASRMANEEEKEHGKP